MIISATPIPGNETAVSRVINNLARAGVTVHHGLSTHVHVSGHASAEELKTFYNVVCPEAVVPVHGEFRHLAANARLAMGMGVDEVEILEDGDVVVLEDGGLRIERGAVSAGYVYVDGTEVGDAAGVIRDRRHLADDGVVIVTVGVDLHSGEIVNGPNVDSHGVTGDTGDLHDTIRERVIASIGTLDAPIDIDVLRTRVRNVARRRRRRTDAGVPSSSRSSSRSEPAAVRKRLEPGGWFVPGPTSVIVLLPWQRGRNVAGRRAEQGETEETGSDTVPDEGRPRAADDQERIRERLGKADR